MIVVLAGGSGGAKLARGMLDVVGPQSLVVVANTGDDLKAYGQRISPDPDLVTWWLADIIHERGWGIRDDTWNVMAALEAAGQETWFRLGDRDLALSIVRTQMLAAQERLTDATAEVAGAVGVTARVLPMSDERVRTHVMTDGTWRPFQEFMILTGARGPIERVGLGGIEEAEPTPEVLAALGEAEAIVIGPSNPVVSIGPILAVAGMREAIDAAAAPVVAVSPFVGGRALKGPTEAFCEYLGLSIDAAGAAAAYAGVIDGLVADDELDDPALPSTRIDTLLDTPTARREVAAKTLEFAMSLAR